MEFSAQQIRFLQDLHADQPVKRRWSAAADYFKDHYNIGQATRGGYDYGKNDHERALRLLEINKLPLTTSEASTRADASQFDMTEKMFSASPHDDSIAIRFIGECSLDGSRVATPPGMYLVSRLSDGLRVACDRIMVVENFETFRSLDRYTWLPSEVRILVVYRGDQRFSLKQASELISNRTEPVLAFYDFDPAGLGMARTLRDLETVLHPPTEWLKPRGKTSQGRNLFESQLPQYESVLNKELHPAIKTSWRAMCAIGGGVAQEAMQAYKKESPKEIGDGPAP